MKFISDGLTFVTVLLYTTRTNPKPLFMNFLNYGGLFKTKYKVFQRLCRLDANYSLNGVYYQRLRHCTTSLLFNY